MLKRLLALLMCCQVLVCPALCSGCCASIDECRQGPSRDFCDCCSSVGSGSNKDSQSNVPCQPGPCDPTSENCNCFCGGKVAPQADEHLILDVPFCAFVDWFQPESILGSQSKSQLCRFNCESDATLFGRRLLRAHCLLLI